MNAVLLAQQTEGCLKLAALLKKGAEQCLHKSCAGSSCSSDSDGCCVTAD
jgi:hypothetical protein